ncbi:MAG: phosphoglucosamine mutase, partial [Actinobacteria bacterium]
SMKKCYLNAGLALDGDAYRVVALDAKGNIVDGDYIMAICAKQMLEESSLGGNMVVTTVMTNMGFHLAMKDLGIKVLSTQVGDKYVLEEMLKTEANLGGEQSGHIIFLEHSPAGDGLQTSLKLLEVMQKTGKSLEELAKVMKRLPQVLLNIKVSNKNGLKENETVVSAIKEAENDLGERGRVLVRPSGTEDLIRVMTESDSQERAQEVAGRVAEVVEKEFC